MSNLSATQRIDFNDCSSICVDDTLQDNYSTRWYMHEYSIKIIIIIIVAVVVVV